MIPNLLRGFLRLESLLPIAVNFISRCNEVVRLVSPLPNAIKFISSCNEVVRLVSPLFNAIKFITGGLIHNNSSNHLMLMRNVIGVPIKFGGKMTIPILLAWEGLRFQLPLLLL